MDSFDFIDNLLSQFSTTSTDVSKHLSSARSFTPQESDEPDPLVDQDRWGNGTFGAMCIIA